MGPVFVFLSHGAYGKNGFIMTTPEKCFPSGSCIIVSAGDETVLFLFGWGMSGERQQVEERERVKERERRDEGMEGEEERYKMQSTLNVVKI